MGGRPPDRRSEYRPGPRRHNAAKKPPGIPITASRPYGYLCPVPSPRASRKFWKSRANCPPGQARVWRCDSLTFRLQPSRSAACRSCATRSIAPSLPETTAARQGEKTTSGQNQTRQSCTDDWPGNRMPSTLREAYKGIRSIIGHQAARGWTGSTA
jgi:hypothetical protein